MCRPEGEECEVRRPIRATAVCCAGLAGLALPVCPARGRWKSTTARLARPGRPKAPGNPFVRSRPRPAAPHSRRHPRPSRPPRRARHRPSAEPGTPGSNTSDLSLPASERAFGGGEPTTSAAAAEEAAAEGEKKDARGLLMKALGVPEDAGWKVYGWIQNSYTGNTNGIPANGFNFGVNPNFLANRWMGNQYYLIFEKPLEQNDEINFGFRVDNLFGNDWQFNHMHGLFEQLVQARTTSPATTPPSSTARSTCPFLTKGGIDIKGGRFYTILPAMKWCPRPAVRSSRSPTCSTTASRSPTSGVLTTLHVTDRINLYNGAINGWDRWINENYKWGYIGGFSWTSKDEKTSLAFTTVWGPNQFPNQLPGNQQIYPDRLRQRARRSPACEPRLHVATTGRCSRPS